MREDALLQLDRRERNTASSLGVRNRMPQGQLVPFPIAGTGVFDSTEAWDLYIRIPSRIFVLVEVVVELYFKQFFAPAKAAVSGGSSSPTTASGGSSTPTTSSGGSSSPTSSSGGSSTPTSGSSSASSSSAEGMHTDILNHTHNYSNPPPSTTASPNLVPGGTYSHSHSIGHTHTVSIGSHDHSVSVPAHDHSVSVPSHAHSVTIDPHGHGLEYGLHHEPAPASIDVGMGLYKRSGSTWNLITSVSGLTSEIETVDLTQWLDSPGSWRLTLESQPGAPNGGRLGVDVAGSVLGAIASA